MRSEPTLKSIAKATGVSRQTVSNVINDPQRVAEPTRSLVQEEIVRAGYRPSAAARQLRTRRSQLLGFRMREAADGINGSIHDRLLHALTERADERGYSILVFAAPDDEAEIAAYRQLRSTNALDGFLLTSTNPGDRRGDWLRENDIPFVAFGRPWGREDTDPGRGRDWIDTDGGAGTEAAVRLLADEGVRRVGAIAWPEGSGAGDDRLDGFQRTCRELGLPADLVERRTDGFENGGDAVSALVARDVEAVVCVSDSLALGAIARLRSLGRRDLMDRVIGFDDTPVARAVGFSSIDQPIELAARRMVDLLVHRIEKSAEQPPSEHTALLVPTVRRRTTTPWPSPGMSAAHRGEQP